jgi:DNA polymerase-3 subunit chi
MAEIRFYQLLHTPLERALPKLLERLRAKGARCLVVAPTRERVEALDLLLWTYDPPGFLAHGSAAIGFAPDQPIWLTHLDENPNGANAVLLVEGATIASPERFEHCLDVFDGADPDAVSAARERYRDWRAKGMALKFFKQTEQGWSVG